MKRSNKYIDVRIPPPPTSPMNLLLATLILLEFVHLTFVITTHGLLLITDLLTYLLIITSIQISLYSFSEESIISVQSR